MAAKAVKKTAARPKRRERKNIDKGQAHIHATTVCVPLRFTLRDLDRVVNLRSVLCRQQDLK